VREALLQQVDAVYRKEGGERILVQILAGNESRLANFVTRVREDFKHATKSDTDKYVEKIFLPLLKSTQERLICLHPFDCATNKWVREMRTDLTPEMQQKLLQERFAESLNGSFVSRKSVYREKFFKNLKYFASKTKLYDKMQRA
jgi:hypothetical protein